MKKIKDIFNRITLREWCNIIAALLFVGLFIFGITFKLSSKGYEIYKESMELKYYAAKSGLVDATQSYIDSIAPTSSLTGIVLVNNCLKYNIDICFVLAQGQKESQYGTQGMARKTNSVFNVYAYDDLTFEQIVAKGKYKTPDDCIEPYLILLTSNYLCNKTEYDLLDEYVDKSGHRYASDPCYEEDLMKLYMYIKNNTLVDKYYQQLNKYRLLLNK